VNRTEAQRASSAKLIFIFVFVLVVAIGCSQRENLSDFEVIIDKTKLLEGDLVFRLGRGTSSQIVNFADKERSYSHVGLLIKDSVGEWAVVHAVPGESEETNGIEVVKSDPLWRFFGKDRTVSGVVVRFDSIELISRQIVEKIKELYNQKLLFDHYYALSDTTTMYCTELVHRVFLNASIDLTEGRRHSIPLFREPIIFPSDILKNNALYEIYEISFRKRCKK
jgi:hypothetical protein